MREAGRLDQDELEHEAADDPEDRRQFLRLALGKVAAQGLERRPDREDGEADARCTIGNGLRADARVGATGAEARGVPGDDAQRAPAAPPQ